MLYRSITGLLLHPIGLSEHDELFRVTLCWLIARSWNGWEFLLRINTKHAILRRNVTQSCWGVPKAGPQHLSHLLPPMLCGFPKDPKLDHILLRTWTTQKKKTEPSSPSCRFNNAATTNRKQHHSGEVKTSWLSSLNSQLVITHTLVGPIIRALTHTHTEIYALFPTFIRIFFYIRLHK